jgi:hydrogenase 3 maturation protease
MSCVLMMLLLRIVRLLKPHTNDRFKVFEGQMTPEAYIGPACASHPTHVLIIDAAELGKKPGTWDLLLPDTVEPGLFTTHSIPAVEVVAEIKRRCGANVVFLGVQPKSREISVGLSSECQRAAEEIANMIQKTLS